MNDLLGLLILIWGGGLWWLTARRSGVAAPASFYCGFMVIDLSLFELIYLLDLNNSDFIFTAMPWPDFQEVFARTVLVYCVLIVAGPISVIGLSRGKYSVSLRPYSSSQRHMISGVYYMYLSASILIFFMELWHFLEVDWSVLWKNDQYLLLNEPVLAGIRTFPGRLIHFALRPIGLVTAASATFFFLQGQKKLATWLALLTMYPFFWALAQNSRWAPLHIAGIVLILLIFGYRKKHVLHVTGWSVVLFLLLIKVLLGRNTPYQGLGNLGKNFAVIFSNMGQIGFWCIGLFLNIFQGAQNIANSLLLDVQFPERYKLLSFMPTVSAVDHFTTIKDAFLVNINPFVPMNAYSEAILFGWPYFVFLILVLIFWLRVMNKLFLKKSALGMAFSVFSYWVILYLSQYPVRNCMRFVYFSLFVGWILLGIKSRLAHRKSIV